MQQLAPLFETKYFVYTQLQRKGQKALWHRKSKLSDYQQWELVVITHFPGRQNSRNLPETHEYYPYYPDYVCYTKHEALHKFQGWA